MFEAQEKGWAKGIKDVMAGICFLVSDLTEIGNFSQCAENKLNFNITHELDPKAQREKEHQLWGLFWTLVNLTSKILKVSDFATFFRPKEKLTGRVVSVPRIHWVMRVL